MARTAFTLAAAVTSAVPGVVIERAAPLSTGTSGRFDAAIVGVAASAARSDGAPNEPARTLVARASTDDATAAELATETIALSALTDGVRELLPFTAPRAHGDVPFDGGRLVVTDFIPGYAVAAPELPPGEGAAASVGRAIAAIHALPPSVVRAVGLPLRDEADVRTETRELLERAIATRRLPVALAARWGAALDDDTLWQFEPTVVLGETGADSFRFADIDDVPTVTGVLGWHALAVGDPAVDLHWTVSAPQAAESVHRAYTEASARTPDPSVRARARLYAELEFAKWLVHGDEQHRDDIVEDAVALLQAVVDGLGGAGPLVDEPDWDDDIVVSPLDGSLGARLAAAGGEDAPTAMQTDTFDPDEFAELSEFTVPVAGDAIVDEADAVVEGRVRDDAADEDATTTGGADREVVTHQSGGDEPPAPSAPEAHDPQSHDPDATAPLDPAELPPRMAADRESYTDTPVEPSVPEVTDPNALWASDDDLAAEEVREAERASRAAFHRWASADSEGTSDPRITRSSDT